MAYFAYVTTLTSALTSALASVATAARAAATTAAKALVAYLVVAGGASPTASSYCARSAG